jgi:hypothetical protein
MLRNRSRSRTLPFATAALALGLAVPTAAYLEIQHAGEVAYVTGGVGDAEQAALREIGGEFNLGVRMAIAEGNYLAGVLVTIRDEFGATVIAARSDGPFLYADLGPGTYEIRAEYEGVLREETVTIDESARPARVSLYW